MLNITFRAGVVEARAASHYGSGSTKIMRPLAAPAPQTLCKSVFKENITTQTQTFFTRTLTSFKIYEYVLSFLFPCAF
jgi:hypothetical protein